MSLIHLGVPPDDRTAVCRNCPFRKDKPNWMHAHALEVNRARIARGEVQHCHESYEDNRVTLRSTPVTCGGANRCLKGGDEMILSPEELAELEPATTEYYYQVFPRVKEEPANGQEDKDGDPGPNRLAVRG